MQLDSVRRDLSRDREMNEDAHAELSRVMQSSCANSEQRVRSAVDLAAQGTEKLRGELLELIRKMQEHRLESESMLDRRFTVYFLLFSSSLTVLQSELTALNENFTFLRSAVANHSQQLGEREVCLVCHPFLTSLSVGIEAVNRTI